MNEQDRTAGRRRALGRETATFISPRPGFTPHTTTLFAAAGLIYRLTYLCHNHCNQKVRGYKV